MNEIDDSKYSHNNIAGAKNSEGNNVENEKNVEDNASDFSHILSEMPSMSNIETSRPIYNSGGGPQINIGSVNFAILSPDPNLNTIPFEREKLQYLKANKLPELFKEQRYTNIIDYLVKKVYNPNHVGYAKKVDAEANNPPDNKEYKRKSRVRNSPMVVHILDEANNTYSVFNEINNQSEKEL